MTNIEENLKKHNIILPNAPAPAANYVPYRIVGNLIYVSGQISANAQEEVKGKLGADLDIEDGVRAAKICAINLLAQLKVAVKGDFSQLKSVVRLGGFVNSTADFTAHPKVINGASDLIFDVMGEKGHHARVAVGSSSLPLGVAVEIEGLFEIEQK